MHSKTKQGIFGYLILLTCFLILIELSYFVLCNKAYLSDFSFVSSHISLPVSIVPGILFFIAAQLAVHLAFCITTWFAATFSGYLFRLDADRVFLLAIVLWTAGVGAAFAANQYYFPNSKFTELSTLILYTQASAGIMASALSLFYTAILVLGAAGFCFWFSEKFTRPVFFFLVFVSFAAWFAFGYHSTSSIKPFEHTAPNVFIIGVDSLRPDFLGYFGAEAQTPFIDYMLNQSTVFTEAVTPLARTFPSWSSILLGQHPVKSGIRFNLADTDHIDLGRTLAARFKKQGYTTIYATDETRFSNIDQHFGFEEVVTPPIGLNDFLLGTFNDFPLSNLLVNTQLGRWLFPYSYANRPVFATYNPDTFIEMLRPTILQSRSHPVFMAVHFCLPHHPYLWSSLPGRQYSPQERYRESIARVDQQLKSFFTLLNQAGLLDKAIVVLLSDHGEALELTGDRITQAENYLGTSKQPPKFYPPSLDDEAINQSAGHGTDVLALPQYHTLLAFKIFGPVTNQAGEVNGVVPLTDVAEAVLSLSGVHTAHSDMAAAVLGNARKLPKRHVFIESDYSPASMRTVYPETRQVMLEGIQLFTIHPDSTRLTVKENMGKMIIRSKQIADIYDDWMLALYPQESKTYTSILINLQTGQWTDDMHSKFAQTSPVKSMLGALNAFYGQNLKR